MFDLVFFFPCCLAVEFEATPKRRRLRLERRKTRKERERRREYEIEEHTIIHCFKKGSKKVSAVVVMPSSTKRFDGRQGKMKKKRRRFFCLFCGVFDLQFLTSFKDTIDPRKRLEKEGRNFPSFYCIYSWEGKSVEGQQVEGRSRTWQKCGASNSGTPCSKRLGGTAHRRTVEAKTVEVQKERE